jgi:hypothetical protein
MSRQLGRLRAIEFRLVSRVFQSINPKQVEVEDHCPWTPRAGLRCSTSPGGTTMRKGRGLSVYSEPNGYHIRHPTGTLNVVAPAGVWQWSPARALQGGPRPDTPAPSSFALLWAGVTSRA